jgi:AcrR family transcriptional regulator
VTRGEHAAQTTRLNRDRVLRAAVAMADIDGMAAISMRNLADRLGVVPMALYKHVANKDELLDGMVDVAIGEIAPLQHVDSQWRPAVRQRILATRRILLTHPWARPVIESRTTRSLAVLEYLDSIAQLFLAGGLSADLTHHVMHAIGSRVWGFTQDVFDNPNPGAAAPDAATMTELTARFPALAAVAGAVSHDLESVVGPGCDDQFEFEFALDILLDGIERLHAEHWTSATRRGN